MGCTGSAIPAQNGPKRHALNPVRHTLDGSRPSVGRLRFSPARMTENVRDQRIWRSGILKLLL